MDPATRQAGWPWPLHKLQANLAAQEARAQPHAPLPVPVVLLMTGGLCPVHKSHVAMMEQASVNNRTPYGSLVQRNIVA